MGQKTSVYLADDVAAAAKASGKSLGELVRRGVESESLEAIVRRAVKEEARQAVREELDARFGVAAT